MFNDKDKKINNNFGTPGAKTNNGSGSGQEVKREEINVHYMPEKFVSFAQRTGHLSRSGSGIGRSSKKLLLVAIGLILTIMVVIAGVIYFFKQGINIDIFNNNQNIAQNQNTDNAVNQNINDNTNQNVNDNINQNINDTNQNINDNTNQNVNDNINQNINDNNYQASADNDNDGLSNEEELVFKTDPNIDDTDRDGYKDGQEILHLYNPLAPSQDLFSSGLVKKFMAPSYGYNLLRPSSWTAKIVETASNIVILPNSESGESFSIGIISGPGSGNLDQLFDLMGPVVGAKEEYENYSLSGVPAYRSKDGQKVLTLNNGLIFFISHETNSFGNINFSTIFDMMLNSFEWTEIGSSDNDEL